MPLHLHRADGSDALATGLAHLLAQPVDDPFAEEVVAVPARGVERWLAQRMSHVLGADPASVGGDGVCAGVRFLSPSSLITLLLGRERDDPWLPDQLVWAVLSALDAEIDQSWAEPLARHLGRQDDRAHDETRAGRRFSLAQRIAWLWHSYAVQRPAVLTAWNSGHDEDGLGDPLADDLLWQPPLWRAVVDLVGEPTPDRRHEDTLRRLSEGDPTLDLPSRLSLFGHTRLARTEAELLAALGSRREVHLWLPQVSETLWHRLAPLAADGAVPRRDDRSADLVHHPLLASLGRDAREVQRTLSQVPLVDDTRAPADLASDGESHGSPSTVLGWLQADLRADRDPTTARPPRPVTGGDDSLQVHACHGPARQVEVLREVLVGLLADDESLQPRDVIVMCPDIETYAPLIHAAFGLDDIDLSLPGAPRREGHPGHRLRVRLADRALTGTNPLLALAAQLIDLAGGRVTAGDVLDLIGEPAVRRRFGFDADDLDDLAGWVEAAAIRWGLNDDHRARYGLAWLQQGNTWKRGLDRLALGVTMAEGPGRHLDDVLPLDDVDGGTSIDLAGRFTECVDRLAATLTALGSAQTPQEWGRVLRDGVRSLTAVSADDAWQSAQLESELRVLLDSESTDALRLNDVRVLLRHRTAGRPTRSNFRTGSLTVCTMTPMRSVPHRVVALLGLDDGVFPRSDTPDGDDVLARTPLTGERDRRSEDRQLLLDAVLAAGEHLVITYSGADEHTGGERPPAVPLGELIDAARETADWPTGRDVVVRHPLQAYDERNLIPGALRPGGPFTFEPAALAGAIAVRQATRRPTALLRDRLPAQPAADVGLDDLVRFFDHPAKALLRDRLDVTLAREESEPEGAITVELAPGLGVWGLGNRLLQDALRGTPLDQVALAERRRGLLPPGELGTHALREQGSHVQRILAHAGDLLDGNPRSVDVVVDLGDGRRLTGTVPGVRGREQVEMTYSKLTGKPQLHAWIHLLALTAGAEPPAAGPWRAHAVGSARHGGVDGVTYGPLEAEWARQRLVELVDLRDRGLRSWLPFSMKASFEYGQALAKGATPFTSAGRARSQWDPSQNGSFPGESGDDAHRLVLGGVIPFAEVLAMVPETDEYWAHAGDRLPRFGQVAHRVWLPALAPQRFTPASASAATSAHSGQG